MWTSVFSYLTLLTAILHWQRSQAINVLGVFSVPLRSHYMAFKPLFEELAARGHRVTVISHYPNERPLKNFKDVVLGDPNPQASRTSDMCFYETMDSNILHLYNFYRHMIYITKVSRQDCKTLLTDRNVKELLSSGERFDVIFVEQFTSDCGLVFAEAHYEAPIIGITSHVLLPWTYSKLGIPFQIGSDSFYFSSAGENPSVLRKVENLILHTIFTKVGGWIAEKAIREVFNENLPGFEFDVEQLGRERMKMVFSYQHFSLTGARLLAPQLLEIAGLHIKQPKSLPDEIERFVNEAEHGVIYVSFGSNLQPHTMTIEKMKIFLDAFMKIPQKIIWKMSNEVIAVDKSKILIKKWLPQLDILCHPKVVGFISHCGMLGTSEAVHCGVPVVSMPFFGDQFSNAAAIRQSGLGRVLNFQQVDTVMLVEALTNITSNEMQEKAKKISQLWHDRPLPALDHAIYWTEYVARNPTAPHALPSKRNSYLQQSLLDVYAVFIILIVALFTVIYLLSYIPWLKQLGFLEGQKIELTGHTPYSADVTPNNFYLFPSVKNKLRGQCFSSREVAVDAFKMHALEISQSELKKCYKNWLQRMQNAYRFFEKVCIKRRHSMTAFMTDGLTYRPILGLLLFLELFIIGLMFTLDCYRPGSSTSQLLAKPTSDMLSSPHRRA
ncbi:UDP-glucuronosyltransferase 2B18 [Eumeta japonica]|uniref:UDP-glucuronosyltransferase 2B18 n=1 Tax=Eumeta variegata TaxID=151549 RepID=A0A4C1YND1_EUMVA|nr:UDP-glucuronosyltransferase 2B18 [Eumeta japonica]